MSLNVYEIITDRIIKSLEGGTVPWRTPWRTSAPKNLISKKPYRGVNVFLLGSARYTSPWWLTYRQAAGKNAQVRKGEHGCPVVFWKVVDRQDDPTKKSFILRYYSVFNSSQCDGLEVPVEEEATPFSPIERAEAILEGYVGGRGPKVMYGGDRACYSPPLDEISLPVKEAFHTPEEYYSTAFHECVHSTGHKDRLNREGITDPIRFASHSYSFEELVAECGASFLSGEAGILDTTFDNSAAYIGHWVGKLKSNPKWIVQAGGQASKAADFVLNRGKDVEEQEGEENT
jgi:antirestriction protein ArdC